MKKLSVSNLNKILPALKWKGFLNLIAIMLFCNLAAEANVPDLMRVKLVKDANNSDEIVIYFASGGRKNYFNQEVALKFFGSNVSISSRSKDNLYLAINKYPALLKRDTIKLSIGANSLGALSMIFNDLANFNVTTNIILIDNFTQTSTDIRANNIYNFTTTSDPNSSGDGRFELRFSVPQPLPTATVMGLFTGQAQGGTIKVNWTTLVEFQVANFILQDSTRHVGYEDLGTVAGSGTTADGNVYLFLDNKLKAGAKRYRLKIVDINGNFTYSNVLKVKNSNGAGFDVNNPIVITGPTKPPIGGGSKSSSILDLEDIEILSSIYPNPASDELSIAVQSSETLNATIQIVNILGERVLNKELQIGLEKVIISEDISNLSSGVYIVSIKSGNNELARTKLIKR